MTSKSCLQFRKLLKNEDKTSVYGVSLKQAGCRNKLIPSLLLSEIQPSQAAAWTCQMKNSQSQEETVKRWIKLEG